MFWVFLPQQTEELWLVLPSFYIYCNQIFRFLPLRCNNEVDTQLTSLTCMISRAQIYTIKLLYESQKKGM